MVTDAQVAAALSAYADTARVATGHLNHGVHAEAMRAALEAVAVDRFGIDDPEHRRQEQRIRDMEPPKPTQEELMAHSRSRRHKLGAQGCPDGGTCHHECGTGACFRVLNAGPLSGVFPQNEWPEETFLEHAARERTPALGKPMRAREKARAMRMGEEVRDAYGKPLTKNSEGEWVNEGGDTPCPRCGEMTNIQCWQCGWVRAAETYPAPEHARDFPGNPHPNALGINLSGLGDPRADRF